MTGSGDSYDACRVVARWYAYCVLPDAEAGIHDFQCNDITAIKHISDKFIQKEEVIHHAGYCRNEFGTSLNIAIFAS